ncbi:hypothetical protein MVLG_01843 [Microbotryum lychnidis-dioicae p1A1 Lamole]|uniref:PHD-type domain-containing protein n=1 Tax=Microbotryum lychnidis-dioicae (strain p1A1 Lamole / MvSl-1064) TaxID=683840 RepID=U5H3C2_USTV1|nr:hypothetical protein MVLG_01843 [Microbotryum lychnidis-dioicae p1A1 Lamole]|eukprot:KDE07935.1 hypothetical protein MVLG_01843 [Microbotryum lychnidis-dioicae p1A1 Lamole]
MDPFGATSNDGGANGAGASSSLDFEENLHDIPVGLVFDGQQQQQQQHATSNAHSTKPNHPTTLDIAVDPSLSASSSTSAQGSTTAGASAQQQQQQPSYASVVAAGALAAPAPAAATAPAPAPGAAAHPTQNGLASSAPTNGTNTTPGASSSSNATTSGGLTAQAQVMPPLVQSGVPGVPPKRPRGRPRKNPGVDTRPAAPRAPAAHITAAAAGTSSGAGFAAGPKPRGRPRGRPRGSRARGGRGTATTRPAGKRTRPDSEDEDGEGSDDSDFLNDEARRQAGYTGDGSRPLDPSEELPDDFDASSGNRPKAAMTKFGRRVQKPKSFTPTTKPTVHRRKRAVFNPDTFLMCQKCSEGHSPGRNRLVICDSCARGWHQSCAEPNIQDSVVDSDLSWLCKQCDAKLAAREQILDISQGTWSASPAFSNEAKREWLETRPLHSLVEYILSIEQKYASKLGSTSLEIWPTDLDEKVVAIKAEREEKRRVEEKEAAALAAETSAAVEAEAAAPPSAAEASAQPRARTLASKRSEIDQQEPSAPTPAKTNATTQSAAPAAQTSAPAPVTQVLSPQIPAPVPVSHQGLTAAGALPRHPYPHATPTPPPTSTQPASQAARTVLPPIHAARPTQAHQSQNIPVQQNQPYMRPPSASDHYGVPGSTQHHPSHQQQHHAQNVLSPRLNEHASAFVPQQQQQQQPQQHQQQQPYMSQQHQQAQHRGGPYHVPQNSFGGYASQQGGWNQQGNAGQHHGSAPQGDYYIIPPPQQQGQQQQQANGWPSRQPGSYN